MLTYIDDTLNKVTMYRLLVYYLGALLGLAAAFSYFGVLPYDPIDLLAGSAFIVAVSWLSSALFARIWKVPMNAESAVITGLILALIMTPAAPADAFFTLLGTALAAMASKFIITVRGKHIFNPAAFGVTVSALFLGHSATWWVGGNLPLLPFVLVGGFLVVRKIRRSDLVLSFILFAIGSTLAVMPFTLGGYVNSLQALLVHSPLFFFFAFVMLTEPLTTPPQRMTRVIYGAVVGFLFAPWFNVLGFYLTPEIALLAGNVFSFIVSPKFKAVMHLTAIRELAKDTYEFVYSGKPARFLPGQYAEMTIGASSGDSRGNRRYFTLASSPTEDETRFGIKFYADPSTFKQLLAKSSRGQEVLVGSVAGDFTLPKNAGKKLVFIAGGIGITPFRSMIKYLLDRKERRDIVLLYSNKTEAEIAYRELFDDAVRAGIGLRVVYTLTSDAPASWRGERGIVTMEMIERHVPDFHERVFYISGPRAMVVSFEKALRTLGIPRWRVRTDYFPGFA